MDKMTLIGFTAAAFTTSAFIPQVLKAWKTKSTHDVSLTMFVMLVTGILLWMIYAIHIRSWPMISANIITLILQSIIIVLKIRYH